MKTFIYPNLNKTHATECTKQTCETLKNLGVEIYMQSKYALNFEGFDITFGEVDEILPLCDNIIVIGGDGTILKCAKYATKYDKAILGINCGRLGFMATLEYDNLADLRHLAEGKYTISNRMMLDAYISKSGVRTKIGTALNDIVLSKSRTCKIADFTIYRESQAVSSLRADGVIFSTPTGASAYSLSAGGPLIEPDIECIEVTQICPHSLFARSMIFSSEVTLMVNCESADMANAIVSIDGKMDNELEVNDRLFIKKSETYLKIISLDSESFFKSINGKLMRPMKEE